MKIYFLYAMLFVLLTVVAGRVAWDLGRLQGIDDDRRLHPVRPTIATSELRLVDTRVDALDLRIRVLDDRVRSVEFHLRDIERDGGRR